MSLSGNTVRYPPGPPPLSPAVVYWNTLYFVVLYINTIYNILYKISFNAMLTVCVYVCVGKEVALFVQEHLAEELVKLDDFKGGDFPQALIRCVDRHVLRHCCYCCCWFCVFGHAACRA